MNIADQPLAEGGDGKIFRIPGAVSEEGVPLLAKLYHDPTPERRHKLAAMLKAPPEACTVADPSAEHGTRVQIAWPTHLIENEAGEILGFAMPEVNLPRTTVLETLLSRRSREAHWLSESYRKRFGAAHNLSVLVASLHEEGHHVVDLKPVNAQLYRETFYVALLDTDGFSVHAPGGEPYPAHQYTPGYIAPEAGRNGRLPEELGEAQDRFALAVVVFQLLNRGLHPYQGVPNAGHDVPTTNQERINAGMYAYGREEHPAQRPSPWSLHRWFDGATRTMFDRAFSEEAAEGRARRPSAVAWKRHLVQYTSSSPERLRPCDKNPAHARLVGQACGLCELEGKRDEQRRRRAWDRRSEPPKRPHASRRSNVRQPQTPRANATKRTTTSSGTSNSSQWKFLEIPVHVPATLTPWWSTLPALFLCIVATLGAAIIPTMVTTEVAFGNSSPSLIHYVQHLFFWVLIVSPMTAVVGIYFNSFRSTWIGLTLIVGSCGASVLVGDLTVFTAWLLCITLYGGYYYAFFFGVPRLNTFTVGTFSVLMALLSIFIVILSISVSAILSTTIHGSGEPETTSTSTSARSSGSNPSGPDTLQIPPDCFHIGMLTPVNGLPVVYLEKGVWTDGQVSMYQMRGADTVQVRSRTRYTRMRAWGHTAGVSSFTRGDTIRAVVRSRSGRRYYTVQKPYENAAEASEEAYKTAFFRSTTIIDTVEIEKSPMETTAYTVPVRFLIADDGSVYVSVKQTSNGIPLKNVKVKVSHGQGIHGALETSDHDSQARILNIDSGAVVGVLARPMDADASTYTKFGHIRVVFSFTGPTTTALPPDRLLPSRGTACHGASPRR